MKMIWIAFQIRWSPQKRHVGGTGPNFYVGKTCLAAFMKEVPTTISDVNTVLLLKYFQARQPVNYDHMTS